jgi:pimeloyl-ACP methyl ester carboxylesterase
MVRHVIYLHGFASSPRSTKATYFARQFAAAGVGYSCPDFNEPDFESLTVTRMLEQTRAAIERSGRSSAFAEATADKLERPDSIVLMGSSLGAFVAIHAAAQDRTGRVERLVLMAPALDFGGNRLRQFGEHGIEEWRRRGSVPFFHHAYNEPREVGFALYEDAARYDAFAVTLAQPTLVFQGTRDASVDPAMVQRWARTQPHVDLRMLDDDHQLTSSVATMWSETKACLGIA